MEPSHKEAVVSPNPRQRRSFAVRLGRSLFTRSTRSSGASARTILAEAVQLGLNDYLRQTAVEQVKWGDLDMPLRVLDDERNAGLFTRRGGESVSLGVPKAQTKRGHRRVSSFSSSSSVESESAAGGSVSLSSPDEDRLAFGFKWKQTLVHASTGAAFEFRSYASPVFARLRSLWDVSWQTLLEAVCGDPLSVEDTAGKSNAFFCFSADRRVVLKRITKGESKYLREMLPNYFDHMARYPDSLLCRFYGLYRVRLLSGGDSGDAYVVLMNNCLDTHLPVQLVYDLKGSTKGRTGSADKKSEGRVILKDNDVGDFQMRLAPPMRAALMAQLLSDARWLSDNDIMDYSFLLGISYLRMNTDMITETPELDVKPSYGRRSVFQQYHGGVPSYRQDGAPHVEIYYVGIIDILQKYNARKTLETMGRSVVADMQTFSAVPPSLYAERFRKFMCGLCGAADPSFTRTPVLLSCCQEREPRSR
ncbi:MAG: hypothetical protein MHM6MM_004847 [Cercozoa sp. M6MM]